MKIDSIKLLEEIALGNVNVQTHPTLSLRILKYSKQCVFSRHWNEITMICRGLVIDDNYNIIVHSMPKFYNHNEADGIPVYESGKKLGYTVYEKWDGSLIQMARWNGNLIITSSGSFQSPQAMKAKELMDEKGDGFIEDGRTYIFELIYPANKIVIDYKDLTQLTLLAIRNTDTGEEITFPYDYLYDWKIEGVEPINKTLEEIELELDHEKFLNREGYVIKFEDGSRVKCKYSEYMRLHKIISGINELFIWESLKDKQNIILENVPDELLNYINSTVKDLKDKYNVIANEAGSLYDTLEVLNFLTRKEQAAWLFSKHKDMAPIVFCMLDKKSYEDKIWKMIRPVFAESKKFGMGECV